MVIRFGIGCGLSSACALVLAACAAPDCYLEQCDIRDRACQQRVSEAVQCIRGGAPRAVPVSVVDAYEYIAEQGEMADAADNADLERRWYRGLSLLHLVSTDLEPSEASAAAWDNVAAFYTLEEKRVVVLDRGSALDSASMTLLLAHEYVHAMQDAEYDLMQLHREHGINTDAQLAVSALIEGEADLIETQLFATHYGYAVDDIDLRAAFASFRAFSRQALVDSREPYIDLRSRFVYAYGSSYVYPVWRDGGSRAVSALYREPPVSTRQVLLGYEKKPPGGEPWTELEIDDEALPVLEPEFGYVGSEHLGAYALWRFLVAYDAAPDDGLPEDVRPVAELRSDVLSVQDVEDGTSHVTAWRLRFASERAAQRLVQMLENATLLRVWSVDRDAFIVAIDTFAAPASADAETWEWGPLPEPEPEAEDDASAARRAAIIE